jgi:hypothetical protein
MMCDHGIPTGRGFIPCTSAWLTAIPVRPTARTCDRE